MTEKIIIHFDNYVGFQKPALLFKNAEADSPDELAPISNDDFGVVFELSSSVDQMLFFKFCDQETSTVEDDRLYRAMVPSHVATFNEVWCRSWNTFVYTSEPATVQKRTASEVIEQQSFADGLYVSDAGGRFALGASVTLDHSVIFGLFHPHAARVYVTGDFNNWQHPNCDSPNPDQFIEMRLYRGYFDVPNVWLITVDQAQVGQRYKFYVEFNALAGEEILHSHLMVDPYARCLDDDYERNDSIIVDPSQFEWHDSSYQTPAIHDQILYELHFPDIEPTHQGKYAGIIDRVEAGYFDHLGVTCLYLMPISEVPTPQGEDALGYNTSLFMAVERDFGTPDELRQLVDTAHQHNLAVIVDQVFNHTANSWNPLWKFILDHPDEAQQDDEGGLYFSGESPWGNRVATERTETQNMLVDACKLMIMEYHIDGFRFDATHTHYMDHGFVHRLADELQAMKPDVILIAENLPNEADLNREGYNGFAQWCDYFHDAVKAVLREGQFEGTDAHPENLGDMFYFSKGKFSAHSNNVVNYCESHDEHSVAHEVSFVDALNTPQAKERKARLGLFATMVALGQPMIYMGQEFGVERPRNRVYFDFPENRDEHGFHQWASRLIGLRQRYPALKLHGYNPVEDGQFHWLLGPWLDEESGGGKRVLGWRSAPTDDAAEQMVILLNFENHPVELDIHFGVPGTWACLASIDYVHDVSSAGTSIVNEDITFQSEDGVSRGFVLPDSSAFIFKWQKAL